ncbi:hypothetical protein C922_03556 [Plasmodium inui San Antonio 1]|uniref:Uncharacterized protein n=1 Tax=Plasmodium inui San Antonio 1 TaxID=1237626 RepID=W7AL68_9APIC|nr:hypothetical protein C922_03556 [Plasmodium inui San Antonio 1]EUD66086.1 hypothetical protein C922_03556 [Plasmodium inui San Antonio 1]
MDGFDETKMKQLQLLKEKMKIAKAQKVEEVKKNEDVFSLSHDVKNVRSFETQDIRFNKIGKKIFDSFTPNKKATHIKGTNSRYPFQQVKSGNPNVPFKTKNGLIKLPNESNAFDTPLTFEEVMRRKNEKKKRELERGGQNGMVDMLNNVRQFNFSDNREDKSESGLLQGMPRAYPGNADGGHADEEGQLHQANHDSHAGSTDVYGHMYSSSPLRQIHETNVVSNYDDASGLHQRKLHDKATNREEASSGYATENNHSINGSISNNTSPFGMDVVKNSQSLSHGMNSFTNYFAHQLGKGQDDAQNGAQTGADFNRTSPHAANNVGNPLSESFPGTSGGSRVGGLFGTRGDLTNRTGSNIFGCSLAKLNQSIFNQTVNVTRSGEESSINMQNGNHSNMTPSASSVVKGEVRGETAHSLFQSSGNSPVRVSSIFGTHNAPIGSNQPGTNSSVVPPSPNQGIEASSLFARNDGNSNGNNTGSFLNNSFSGNNLSSTRNTPDLAGKSGLFNNTSDGSGGNVFGKSRSNVHLFSGSGGIFGKSNSGATNLFGIAPNEKNPFGSAANEKNPFGSAANGKNPLGSATNEQNPFGSAAIEKNPLEKANIGKGIFGNVPGSSKPFGNAAGSDNLFGGPPSGSNIFGTPANASSNPFGRSSGGTNLFNKNGGASSTSQFGNARSFFGKPPVGRNIFGASSSLVNNVSSSLNSDGTLLADAARGAMVSGVSGIGSVSGVASVAGLLSANAQSAPDSRCGAPAESLLNTSGKLISDGPKDSSVYSAQKENPTRDVAVPSSTNGVGLPSSSNNVGLPSSEASGVTDPSQGYLGRVPNGMRNNSDVNARVMQFKNTLSNIKSKTSGGPNEPMERSSGDSEAQVAQKGVADLPDTSENPPGGDPLGVEKNDAHKQSESLQYQNEDKTRDSNNNNDVAAQPRCDRQSEESAKACPDNDKGEGTNIRRTFSSYFNTFIPSIFSSPNKQAVKEEYPKGDASNVEVKTGNVEVETGNVEVETGSMEVETGNLEVNKNVHVSPLGKDVSEGDKPDTNPLCSDKEGKTKTFFRAPPLRDPPNGTLPSETDGGNTVTNSRDSVLLNGEKINEPLHFDPFVDSDNPNCSNHEAPSFSSQNETQIRSIGEPPHEQIHNTKTGEVLNLPFDVSQNGAVNPLSDENNKTGSLFNHAGSVPTSAAHPGVEGKMDPTAGIIPFSNVNAGRTADEVGTIPNTVTPALDEKSGKRFLVGSALHNVNSQHNSGSATSAVFSRDAQPRGIFQKDPSHNHLIEVDNADSLENKEHLEKMNQIYKNINCINKNISYINKYVPSTIEDVDNYLQGGITSVQNYDALSSANRTCLEKMNAPGSSAQSNKELKNMINVLNKQMGKGGGPSGGGDNRGVVALGPVKGTLFCNPFNRASQVDMTHNTKAGVMPSAPDGGSSRCYPIFNATGKQAPPGGNLVNTNMLTPREKLKLINETSKEIATNEESDVDEKIPEHVQKIMERREYFKTKNKLTNSDSKKSIIGMKKIKPFVPSECSESFRNTFYTNENSKNKNNVFSLQNLSSMNILSPNQGSSSAAASGNIMGIVERGLNNNAFAPLGGEAPPMMNSVDHFKIADHSNNGAAAIGTSYPTVDDRSAIFKDYPVEEQSRSETHTHSSSANFFIYKNMPPSSSNTMMNCAFSSENAQDGYNPLVPTRNCSSAINSGELIGRVNGSGRGGETKPSGESLMKMEEELNRQTDFISNIYTRLGKNNFIYDNREGIDSTADEQRGDLRDDGVDPAVTNTDDTPLRKRSLDSISRVHHENDDVRDDECNPFDNVDNVDNVENADDDDPTCSHKKKRKFTPNEINSEMLQKENRCIDISNCVKEIRDSMTLEDISANLSKYTLESERILCDIINDTFKMSLKISSLSDLPFLFEDSP